MPLLYVDVVNAILKRVGVVAGDSAELGTGTSTATANQYAASTIFTSRSDIQHSVDLVLQMCQEGANEIYSLNLAPNVMATATIIVLANTREYAMPSDFERVAGENASQRVLRAATTARVLPEYPGGYLQMLADQPVASDWIGDANSWAISPRNEALRLDREATASGVVYNLAYERRVDLTSTMASATMPFSDTVCRSLIPAVAEYYNRTKNKDFDPTIFRASLIRAIVYAQKSQNRNRWGTQRI